MRFDVSNWRSAPISLAQETVFAVGDIHGCSSLFGRLLNEIAHLAEKAADPRLVFLGDLISKGPDSLGALELWAGSELLDRFASVDRLFGNHEQLLLLSISDDDRANEAERTWTGAGRKAFLEELRVKTGRADAFLTRELLCETTSKPVIEKMNDLKSHVKIGNLVFVHGGIDPALGLKKSLEAPWTEYGGNHWAWIKAPFLRHTEGFGKWLIIHGHTVPAQHRELSGRPDPHVLEFGRLSLDGGSTQTGIVMAAQFKDGRYRLLKASSDAGIV